MDLYLGRVPQKSYPRDGIEECRPTTNALRKDTPASSSSQKTQGFVPTCTIVSTVSDIELSAENNYEVRFSSGMIDGAPMIIDEDGKTITVTSSGSYKFDFNGQVIPYSDVEVQLKFEVRSEVPLPEGLSRFTTFDIPAGEHVALSTIIPLKEKNTISLRLLPSTPEKLRLRENTRLVVYRIA